jgi:CBS domain-containing protein
MTDTPIQPHHRSRDYVTVSVERATVADAMHPGILSCEAETHLIDVARMMVENRVHCIVVMGIAQNHVGEALVWGIISDLDLVRAAIRFAAKGTAGALAKRPFTSVEPTTPLLEAGELMLTHSVDHLVVVPADTSLPIGILSTLDIARALASSGG